MNRPISTALSKNGDIFSQSIRRKPLSPQDMPQRQPTPPQRKYEVSYLTADGHLRDQVTMARVHPAFEAAFAALGHGAILQTNFGHMTVEDVFPGDSVRLADGNYDTVLWRGRMTIHPDSPQVMTRFTADAMGYERPTHDLVLGPSARILHRANGLRDLTGSETAFIPAADFVDGNNIISLKPNTPLTVYQLGFASQRTMSINGMEIESLHPGTAFTLGLHGDALGEYLSLFPHKQSFEDFGLIDIPRLRMRDLELIA